MKSLNFHGNSMLFAFFLLLNLHALCLSFSFENTLIDFEFLFRYFDDCLFINALKHMLSDRFFCKLCRCNLNILQLLQPENAPAPILLTFFPMVTFFSFTCFLNAFLLISVTRNVIFPSSLLMAAGTVKAVLFLLTGFIRVTVHPVASAFVTL